MPVIGETAAAVDTFLNVSFLLLIIIVSVRGTLDPHCHYPGRCDPDQFIDDEAVSVIAGHYSDGIIASLGRVGRNLKIAFDDFR